MRLVFFGDSLTWGGYGGNFVDEIKRLRPQHAVINAGRGGDTVLNLLHRLDHDVLTHHPDGVFVMVGGNDAVSYSQPETRPYYRRRHSAPDGIMTIDVFARTYRELLTKLQLAHVLTWIALQPNEYNPALVEAQRLFNDHAREEAESMGIPVIDFMEAFPPKGVQDRPPLSMKTIRLIGQRETDHWNDFEAERAKLGYTFSFDGMHITPETAAKMAQMIVELLNL